MTRIDLNRIRVIRRSSGSYEARTEGDSIFLNDKFFAQEPSAQRFVLLHELGHWFRARYVPLAEIMGWELGQGFYDLFGAGNSDEGFAEAVAVHLTNPQELQARYPDQARKLKRYLDGNEARMRKWVDRALAKFWSAEVKAQEAAEAVKDLL